MRAAAPADRRGALPGQGKVTGIFSHDKVGVESDRAGIALEKEQSERWARARGG